MTWFGEPPCALVSVTLFLIAFIYTPLGVFLVADVNSIFATIHYSLCASSPCDAYSMDFRNVICFVAIIFLIANGEG